MQSSGKLVSGRLVDVVGLRFSGIFPTGKEPSIRTLRHWTKTRRFPHHKVGHFVYYDPDEVSAHIRGKLQIPAGNLDAEVVRRNRPNVTRGHREAVSLPRKLRAGNTRFKISEFVNPSGAISFRVSGWLRGIRIRRNFQHKIEAQKELDDLELKRMDTENSLRTVITRLPQEQLREAESIYQDFGTLLIHPLRFYIQLGLDTQKLREQTKPLDAAVIAYVDEKSKENAKTVISASQLSSINREMKTLKLRFPNSMVADFTPEILTDYFERGAPSLKTYNNRRGLVSTFFQYAKRHGWIRTNPVKKTRSFRLVRRRGSATTLSAEKASQMMAFLEGHEGSALVPYFALCLFAGIRPCFREGEMSRLRPTAINLETGVIHIEPEVSKVRMKRLITIQPNLKAWLQAYPLNRHSLIPKNMTALHRAIFKEFELSHDILRHTYISMFVGKFRSIAEAALQAGNSEEIIRRHYLDLKSPNEAELFFSIYPRMMQLYKT